MILIQSIKANLNLPGPYSGHVHLAKGRADPCSKEKAEEQIFILLTILQQTHRIIAFAIFNQFWLTSGKVFYSCETKQLSWKYEAIKRGIKCLPCENTQTTSNLTAFICNNPTEICEAEFPMQKRRTTKERKKRQNMFASSRQLQRKQLSQTENTKN